MTMARKTKQPVEKNPFLCCNEKDNTFPFFYYHVFQKTELRFK